MKDSRNIIDVFMSLSGTGPISPIILVTPAPRTVPSTVQPLTTVYGITR